jgi:N-acetylmuramoyl-L-alanine amidase
MKVALDPGHGGKDPGAVGPNGLAEAPTVLTICQELAELLHGYGYHTHLTRKTEVYVALGERCESANDWGATYCISVHCNSDGPTAVGIETLYKSEKGKALATPIQAALVKATGDRDRSLKHRTDLYILNGTLMPCCLVEVGFISHPQTEKELMRPDYLTLLAEAIAGGFKTFIGSLPTAGQHPIA